MSRSRFVPPRVSDPELQRAFDQLYRDLNQIAEGTLAETSRRRSAALSVTQEGDEHYLAVSRGGRTERFKLIKA